MEHELNVFRDWSFMTAGNADSSDPHQSPNGVDPEHKPKPGDDDDNSAQGGRGGDDDSGWLRIYII